MMLLWLGSNTLDFSYVLFVEICVGFFHFWEKKKKRDEGGKKWEDSVALQF